MSTGPERQMKTAILKDIIKGLHGGVSVEQAKERFEKEIGEISSTEIAALEQGLIDEGVSVDEIKRFCNVHALLFQSALERATQEETSPSHPVALFRSENAEIEKRLAALRKTAGQEAEPGSDAWKDKLQAQLLDLKSGLETHYERKEQVLFPHLEKVGFMGPSKVMWGKDNEVRDLLKAALSGLDSVSAQTAATYIADKFDPLLEEIEGMIFKEENILFPTSLEKLDQSTWVNILKESDEVGYGFIQKPAETDELIRHLQAAVEEEASFADGAISLPSGQLGLSELMCLLNTLPVDLTFVDSEDRVRYFTEGTDRIFSRPRSVIGRQVQNCHPPQSLDVVERIIASFRDGSRDFYEFWLQLGGKFVHIRYFALRDSKKRYLGTLEVSQDLTRLKTLEGEKRLIGEGD